jgi:hypothetical protein
MKSIEVCGSEERGMRLLVQGAWEPLFANCKRTDRQICEVHEYAREPSIPPEGPNGHRSSSAVGSPRLAENGAWAHSRSANRTVGDCVPNAWPEEIYS